MILQLKRDSFSLDRDLVSPEQQESGQDFRIYGVMHRAAKIGR